MRDATLFLRGQVGPLRERLIERRDAASEREAYERLTDPASEDFLGRTPDYCGFITYTMFTARVP